VTLFLQGHQFLVSRPPLPEEGPIQADPISATSKAPETKESQDGDDAEGSLEGTSSTTSPPPAHSEDLVLTRRGNVLRNSFLRVPLLPRLLSGSLLLPMRMRNFSTS
jgi:hypothetical protein